MDYTGQKGEYLRNKLLGYSFKGTHIFPLRNVHDLEIDIEMIGFSSTHVPLEDDDICNM